MSGRVVILNGAPRSGKSTLARAIQAEVPGTWLNWGVDAFNSTLPPALMPGIGLRPGGERPDLEPEVARLYAAFGAALRAFADRGFDVVADLGLHRRYASGLDPAPILLEALHGLPRLIVGIDCPIQTIMERRNADPRGGFYAAGPGVPPPVQLWQDAVHEALPYDLRLDMGTLTASEGAARIAKALQAPI